jgi:hypothetical protein
VNTQLTLADLIRYAKEAGLDDTTPVRVVGELSGHSDTPAVHIENGMIYLA